MRYDEVKAFHKRYIEPWIAIFILIGLFYACYSGYQNVQAKKDIAKDCGWVDEDVRCRCEKNYVVGIENKLKGVQPEVILSNGFLEVNLSDVPLG